MKVGDKVVCVCLTTESDELEKGETYTIIDIWDDKNITLHGIFWAYSKTDFITLSELRKLKLKKIENV